MSAFRQLVKRLFPPVVPLATACRQFQKRRRALRLARKSRAEIFTDYFDSNQWADADSLSGQGSNLPETRVVRALLPELIGELHLRSMADVPCGDFFWMSHVVLDGVDYVGGDIVGRMIERNQQEFGSGRRRFMVLDLCLQTPPESDLILCRDALVHLSNRDALAALANLRASNSRYLLTTTFPTVTDNVDIVTGMWRPINLMLPPFGLPEPLRLINEGYEGQHGRYRDKSLGLWRLADVPSGDSAAASTSSGHGG